MRYIISIFHLYIFTCINPVNMLTIFVTAAVAASITLGQATGFTMQVLCVFAWTTYKQCPG